MTLIEKLRAYIPWIISGIILLGYAFFISFMTEKTKTSNEEWVKLTYIFGSVEAIVFAAVGFIFGNEVNRSRVITAEKNEEKAKREKIELAKEILDKLPVAPSTPDSVNFAIQNVNNLRNMAEKYREN